MEHKEPIYPRKNFLRKPRPFYHDTDIIKVLTGVRRCGKSCIMQMVAEEGVTYLFIDEVQNVEGFEEVLNSWREEGTCSIFITGRTPIFSQASSPEAVLAGPQEKHARERRLRKGLVHLTAGGFTAAPIQ